MLKLRTLLACSLVFSAAFAAAQAQVPDPPISGGAAEVAPTATSEPVASAPIPSNVENAVVKVFSTLRNPDPFKPWTKQAPSEVTGSGVVIEGKRILTNAHVVLYASQVQIQANQAGDKVSAHVEAIAPGIDLAVLKLDDESFFDTHAAVVRASRMPQIKDAVMAYGYPTGGNSLSITKGIVSRIEFTPYNLGAAGMRIQIDAAINPGNSGGPAIAGDKMIGLAFSRLGDAQNIGYIIPNEEIELFLQDIADGHYDGKLAMFDDLQTLENPALRAYLKLDKSVSGIVVHHPLREEANYPLKEWDVITQIGDMPIDDEGMIKLGPELRVYFEYMIQKIARNNQVPLTLIRAGKTLQVQLPVLLQRPSLFADLKGAYPPYFIYGPLVFSKATYQSFSVFGNKEWAAALAYSRSPLLTSIGEAPSADRDELVVVASQFLPHKVSQGYLNPMGAVVYSVNGVKVKNLRHLVALLRDLKSDFVTFEFERRGGEALVFSRKEIMAATDDILNDNGIREQGSDDLMAVWRGK